LTAQLVADVADEPGALPLLQYALTELYERREGNTLTADAYRTIGGVSGALAGRAEEIYDGLGEQAQGAARQLFLRLVTLGEGAEDTRRRVERTELASMEVDQDALEEAIQAFGAWRLLSFDRDPRTGTPTIEVAHEALMREWGRSRRWIDSGREQVRLHRRLASAAREWEEAEREPSYLLRGSNLAQFDALAAESTIALTELERQFVDASRTANALELARERQRNRRLRTLLAGAVGLLVLAIIAGALALASRATAQREARVALGRQLGAEAVSQPRIDLAMLLARESLNLDKSPQTEGTLLTTLLRSPAAIATFTFPSAVRPCCAMSVSPDGSILGVPDNVPDLRLVRSTDHKTLHVFPRSAFGTPPAFTADGSSFAYFTSPKPGVEYVAVRDTKTLAVQHKLRFDKLWQKSPATNPNVALWFTPDGRSLLFLYQLVPPAATTEAFVDRWDLATGKVTGGAVGPDGAASGNLVAGGRDLAVVGSSEVTFVDTKTLRVRHVRVGGPPLNPSTAVSPDGTTLAEGSDNGSITFIDLRNQHRALGQGGHSAPVVDVSYSPNGRQLVTTAEDGSVIVWNPRTRTPIERLNGHASRVLGVAFSGNGRTLFTSSLDGAVFEWDLGTQRRFGHSFTTMHGIPQLSGDAQSTPPLAISPDGSRFAARNGDKGVGIYSTATGKEVAGIGPNREAIGLAWSSQGVLSVAGAHGLHELWSVPRRNPPQMLRVLPGLRSINGQPEAVLTTAFSPDGTLVVDGDVNHTPGQTPWRFGSTAVWNARSGKLLWLRRTKQGGINAVAFSPDGKTLAAGREDGSVLIYDATTGHLRRTLHLFGGGSPESYDFETLAFASDGTLATGTWAGAVQLWDPNTGAQIRRTTPVAAAPVASLSFSPDAATFAEVGGSDGLAKLWTTVTEQQLGATFPGDPGQWGNAQYTPDGSHLVVVYQDGKAFVWPTSLGAWEQHACDVAGRNFTPEEWQRFVGSRSYSAVCPGSRG
jgi:WD40 repeat protein